VESTFTVSPMEKVGQPIPLLQLEKITIVDAKITKGNIFFKFFKNFIIDELKH